MPTSSADVEAFVRSLPSVTVVERYGNPSWCVGGKSFAWERPFSKADIRRYGEQTPPEGPILAVRLGDRHEKEAVLAEGRPGVFTIPHFDGYATVLVQLRRARKADVRELLQDAWAACAPPKVLAAHPDAR